MEGVDKKVCTNCKIEKISEDFHKDISRKDGIRSWCKVCVKKHQDLKKEYKSNYNKEYNKKNKEKRRQNYIDNKDRDLKAAKDYYIKNKEVKNNQSKSWYANNKDRHKELTKAYYENNKESIKEYSKDWLDKNRDKANEYQRTYTKRREQEDLIYKMTRRIRSNIREAFKRGKFQKRNNRTENILGCTIPEFIEHLQSLFVEGMTLENHGNCEECWHIDHKIPISLAKTEEEVIKLNHYTNLQPLWSRDNLTKGKKYE